MKKAAQMAWGAMAGLIGMAVVLVVCAFMYHVSAFWAGAMLCAGQALVMGLAAWGLSLARQAEELREASDGGGSGFRMSVTEGDPGLSTRVREGAVVRGAIRGMAHGGLAGAAIGAVGRAAVPAAASGLSSMSTGGELEPDLQTLDTGFQRTLVFIAGLVLAIFSGLTFWVVIYVYRWSQMNPDRAVPVTGTLGSALMPLDSAAVLAGLAASATYIVLHWFTRPSRQTGVHGEAASSNFMLGLAGMAALGAASVLGYFKVSWASEAAAAIIGMLMLLQGLELIVNAFRSYSSIEELDQEAVDLQATPLGPMLASMWLGGLRMLLAQSVGLSGEKKGERGVIARMMPRVLLALLVIAIGASCFRVVPPGQVAVLERLGYAPVDADGRPTPEAILPSGLHVTMPWPIDELVYIPTQELQVTDVGKELHAPGEWKNIDFQFWMVRPPSSDQDESKDLFLTGDAGSPQFMETYVQVRWRVADPARFYAAMSHSEFFEKSTGGDTQALPVFEAMVQQAASFAVTRTFGNHTMEQILVTDRTDVAEHCREILQEKLDSLCRLPGDKTRSIDPFVRPWLSFIWDGETRGIDVAYLTIKDLHPPYWKADRPDTSKPVIGGKLVETDQGWTVVSDPQQPSQIARGPASAFELVVSMREFREETIDRAEAQAIALKNQAHGDAQSAIADAHAYSSQKVAQAHGDADRFVEMTKGMSSADLDLMKRRLLFDTAKDLFDPVTKIVVDPAVSDVQIIQETDKGMGTFRPPGN